MSLVEELHAAHKARLARMEPVAKAQPAVSLEEFNRLEAKFYKAQALISELEETVAKQRAALKAFADKDSAPLISDVVAVVAKHFEIPKSALLGKGRALEIVQPRHISHYLCRKFGYSLHQIGRAYGRDHTTIVHSSYQVRLRAEDAEVASLLQSLEAKVTDYAAARASRGHSHD